MERVKELIDDNLPYDMIKDACGHAVYQALSAEKLPKGVSAQTATLKALDSMVQHDKELTNELDKGIIALNINKTGDDVGEELLRYEQSNIEKTTESESKFKLK